MNISNSEIAESGANFAQFPLLSALHSRRSRRFGLGMKMPGGPLAYQSGTELGAAHGGRGGGAGFRRLRRHRACAGGFVRYTRRRRQGASWPDWSRAPSRAVMGCKTVALIITNDEATYLIRLTSISELPATGNSRANRTGATGCVHGLIPPICALRLKLAGRLPPWTEPLFNIKNANGLVGARAGFKLLPAG